MSDSHDYLSNRVDAMEKRLDKIERLLTLWCQNGFLPSIRIHQREPIRPIARREEELGPSPLPLSDGSIEYPPSRPAQGSGDGVHAR